MGGNICSSNTKAPRVQTTNKIYNTVQTEDNINSDNKKDGKQHIGNNTEHKDNIENTKKEPEEVMKISERNHNHNNNKESNINHNKENNTINEVYNNNNDNEIKTKLIDSKENKEPIKTIAINKKESNEIKDDYEVDSKNYTQDQLAIIKSTKKLRLWNKTLSFEDKQRLTDRECFQEIFENSELNKLYEDAEIGPSVYELVNYQLNTFENLSPEVKTNILLMYDTLIEAYTLWDQKQEVEYLKANLELLKNLNQ